jgi:hypothetical protein
MVGQVALFSPLSLSFRPSTSMPRGANRRTRWRTPRSRDPKRRALHKHTTNTQHMLRLQHNIAHIVTCCCNCCCHANTAARAVAAHSPRLLLRNTARPHEACDNCTSFFQRLARLRGGLERCVCACVRVCVCACVCVRVRACVRVSPASAADLPCPLSCAPCTPRAPGPSLRLCAPLLTRFVHRV